MSNICVLTIVTQGGGGTIRVHHPCYGARGDDDYHILLSAHFGTFRKLHSKSNDSKDLDRHVQTIALGDIGCFVYNRMSYDDDICKGALMQKKNVNALELRMQFSNLVIARREFTHTSSQNLLLGREIQLSDFARTTDSQISS